MEQHDIITNWDAIHSNLRQPCRTIPLDNGGSLTVFRHTSLLQPPAGDYYEICYTDHSGTRIASRWTITDTTKELDRAIESIQKEYFLKETVSNISIQKKGLTPHGSDHC